MNETLEQPKIYGRRHVRDGAKGEKVSYVRDDEFRRCHRCYVHAPGGNQCVCYGFWNISGIGVVGFKSIWAS
jgi:hypothetical protein